MADNSQKKSSHISDKTFQTVFKQSPISTQVFSPDGKTLMVNRAWEKLWGVKLEDMKNFNILTDPQLKQSGMMRYIKKGFSGIPITVPPHKYEPREAVKGSKATTRWVRDYIHPIKNAKGEILHVVMQHEDITKEKIAQDSLKQSEEFFRTILEHSTDAISLIDPDGTLKYSTPSRKHVLGYDVDETYGNNALSLVHPDDIDFVKKTLGEVVKRKNSTKTIVFRVRHKNGAYIWAEVTGTNLLHIPHVNAVVINYRDITKRHEAEQKLQESEAQFRRLFDSNILGIFMSTYDGTFIEANDAFLQLIGYSRNELKKKTIHRDKLTPTELHYLSKDAVKALNQVGSSNTYEKEYIHKDGYRIPVLIAVTRIGEDICIGFAVDISERKELEKRKDDFISMASHELKTPITSLKIFLQTLERQCEKNGDTSTLQQLEKMNHQVDRLTRLIKDLLDVSKINAGKINLQKENFSLYELIEELKENISAATDHKIVFRKKKDISLFADRDRIGQVLINFLTNAAKYSPQESEIRIFADTHNNEVTISVQDFGRGIPKSQQQKIFERFYQVSETNGQTFPGLGMGLYISSEIIKLHGGTIQVKSKVGEGSTFTVTLPQK